MVLPAEFSLIARHFRPLAGPGALDLTDDAAVLTPPPGRQLVLTADAMVAGVHFLPDDPPDLVGRKLLRVNLSDLAAKGAVPLGYLMTVSTPKDTPEAWFAGFASRPGAGPGDLRGDAAGWRHDLDAGSDFAVADDHWACCAGHRRASVRREGWGRDLGDGNDRRWRAGTGRGAGPAGRSDRFSVGPLSAASAASRVGVGRHCLGGDGCVGRSGPGPWPYLPGERAGGGVFAGKVPLSDAARAAGPDWLVTCLTGGDDYELLLAVPPARSEALRREAGRAGIAGHSGRRLPFRTA